jgi:hypothetical protein
MLNVVIDRASQAAKKELKKGQRCVLVRPAD